MVVDGEPFDPVTVDSSVPQGTVLGPLPVLCHINDLPDCAKSTYASLRMMVYSTAHSKPGVSTNSYKKT